MIADQAAPENPGQGPRWRHDRILFDVEVDGALVSCSVSKAAIQDAGGRHSNLPRDLMSEFMRLRDRIEAAALLKLRSRAEGAEGTVHLWSADLDDDPEPPSVQAAAGTP